ncbi:hypothetical protein [Sporosarcina aquimarina]|uniref:Lipoprotein n=1 Tax=Sporosarcina aquimarina TaxID=114975 RepID=A0ABU4FXG9_9BACL|nr:hypothetical protein [Sporosarcina aquimarina]MDW0109395.1 hypothetical protein [Sporosarcina aquimarina]
MKNKKLLYTALSASLLLAACGTDTSDQDNENTTVDGANQTEGTDGTVTEGTESHDSSTENAEDTTTDDTDSDDATSENTDDTEAGADDSQSGDAEDGSTALEGAEDTDSDEQDFKMQVLPEYKLTSEEPGRDVLYAEADSEYFMKVETTKASESDYDKSLENWNETLAASSSEASPVELTDEKLLPQNDDFEKLKAYRVAAAEGPITAMIFQRDDLLVRVMMYDNTDEKYYDDFLRMAETIQAK